MRVGPALRSWRTWGVVAIVAFFAMLAYYFVSGMLAPQSPPNVGQQQMIMRGITGQARKGRDLAWRFSADSTATSPDGMVTTYYRAKATYYLHGKPAYRLIAPQVQVDVRSQDYSASGGVHVWSIKTPSQQDFKTDYITWNQAAQTLTCPGPVHMTYNGVTMITSRLSANLRTGDTQFGKTSVVTKG